MNLKVLALQASIEDIPLAHRKRSSAKTSPKIPVKSGELPAATQVAAAQLDANAESGSQTSVEDIPLAQRKRSAVKPSPPASPFAKTQLVSPRKTAVSALLTASASATVHSSQQLTQAQGSKGAITGAGLRAPAEMSNKGKSVTAKKASETTTAAKIFESSSVPHAKALHRSDSRLPSAAASKGQHKVGSSSTDTVRSSKGDGAPHAKALHRSDSNAASQGQHRGSDAGGTAARSSKDNAARSLPDKERSSSGLKAVKGLPALSRSLSKKGSSSRSTDQANSNTAPAAAAAAAKVQSVSAVTEDFLHVTWAACHAKMSMSYMWL